MLLNIGRLMYYLSSLIKQNMKQGTDISLGHRIIIFRILFCVGPEDDRGDQCSFWPQINLDSSYLDMGAYQPIQERLQDLLVSYLLL